MDKQNGDSNTQELKASQNVSDKENTNTENEKNTASAVKLKQTTDDITTSTEEEVKANGDKDGPTTETKSDNVNKSSNGTEATNKKEASDLSDNLKDKDKKQHSQSSKDNCDTDNAINNNKKEQTSKTNDDDKENVESKHSESDNDENNTDCDSNSKPEENSLQLKTTEEHDKLDLLSSSSSQDVVVDPLAKKNDDSAKEPEQKDENEEDSKDLDNDEVASVNNEDTDGEFEDVEVPDDVDEIIVPDDEGEDLCTLPDDDNDGDEVEEEEDHQETPSNDEEITKDSEPRQGEDDDETSNSKSPEDYESHDGNIEPELVAIEQSAKESNSSETEQTANDAEEVVSNNGANDPLNCLEATQQSGEDTNHSESAQPEGDTNSEANQDDDDDVEFIETRNSPICIESDEEDSRDTETPVNKQTISLPTATITVPKNLTVTRTSARKSTARPSSASSSPQTVPQSSSGKSKNFSYLDKATTYRRSLPSTLTIIPQQVVDTIEVLDSSDEDSVPANNRSAATQHNLRTPPKRTLMAAKGANHKVPNKVSLARRGGMPNHLSTHIKQQPRKPAPPPLPPPTPQSNFLNNVQLQPATTGSNPPAFSALLSNKSVIIPNAFYGNHPSVRGNPADAEMERRYVRWLENFMAQFCNPQLVASHSCFVFLQRSLKYKDFVRIKAIRTNLNVNAQKATEQLNHQLMLDLRAIFLKSSKEITPHGRRFCEMACSTPQNKTVTLLIHASTGRIIMKSCNMEAPIATASSAASTSNSKDSSTTARKRKLEEDEYVPVKNKIKSSNSLATSASENGDDDDEGRKRSLRSKRSKRIDNSFSYNEDDLAEYDIDDEEEAERTAQAEIQRKIDEKRLEAQRQRQQQAKSFESAFIQAFGKELNKSNNQTAEKVKTAQQIARLNNSMSTASVQQHAANNDAEDLLQATWIENVENEEAQIISDDEEPKQHRIYKQSKREQQQQHQQQKQLLRSTPKLLTSSMRKGHQQEKQQVVMDARHWPKNTDVHLHAISKTKDVCVICKLMVPRVVHHYVNEHRGCEVYNSRLTSSQVEHLRRGASNIFNVSLYKNGQPQYEAHCIFCQKLSKFMLPYWIQHFTMHTGEYAYRCSGCGIRKPTRSLLTQHHSQGCAKNGHVLQDYTHDTKKIRVEARICTLCNYVQLHRSNIVKHLHLQHGIKQVLPKHIQTIVLLQIDSTTESPASRRQQISFTTASATENTYVIDDDDDDDDGDDDNDDDTLLFGDAIQTTQEQQQLQQNHADPNAQNYSYNYIPPYMMNANAQNNITWEDNDPAEDLSYMICGMLDVEMDNE